MSVTPISARIFQSEAAERNRRLANAKLAHDIFGHRAGRTPEAFERRSNQEQAAWLEVVQFVEEDVVEEVEPECPDCEIPLVCPKCDGPACAGCGVAITSEDYCAACSAAYDAEDTADETIQTLADFKGVWAI